MLLNSLFNNRNYNNITFFKSKIEKKIKIYLLLLLLKLDCLKLL